MFIIVMGGSSLDESSQKNPLKALVKSIVKAQEKDRQAEQIFIEKSEAENLKLDNKAAEADKRLLKVEQELQNICIEQMQLLSLIPINGNPALN